MVHQQPAKSFASCLRSWPRCVVETASSTLCGMAVSSRWIYCTSSMHRDERAKHIVFEASCEARFVRSIPWWIRHWHGLLVSAESWWHLRVCCAWDLPSSSGRDCPHAGCRMIHTASTAWTGLLMLYQTTEEDSVFEQLGEQRRPKSLCQCLRRRALQAKIRLIEY